MKTVQNSGRNRIQEMLQYALKLHQSGNLNEAEIAYRKIINQSPKQADALHLLGLIEYQKKNYEASEIHISKAIRSDGSVPFFYLNLGNTLREQGRVDEAVESYKKAIRMKPDFAEARYNLANELFRKGLYEEAILHYKAAILINPAITEFHFNLAKAMQESEDYDNAVSSYIKALSLNPRYAEAYYNLGIIFQDQKKYNRAVDYYAKAIQLKPDYEAACYNLGDVLNETGRFAEAESYLKMAVSITPDFAEAYNNLSISLRNQGKISEALAASGKALEIRPDFAEAHNNLGIAYRALNENEKAVLSFKNALTVNPYLSEAHWNMSLAMLSAGDFERGWKKYEWRFLKKNAVFRDIPCPIWDGVPRRNKSILVYSEQGIGDEIMFISCLPELLKVMEKCTVECDKRLAPLFSRSFPDVKFIERGSPMRGFDFRIPIGSLPKFFRNSINDFPETDGYLVPDIQKLAIWKERMNELGEGLKIGISWRGGKDPSARSLRSTTLDQWKPLFSVPGARFVNLQYEDCSSELKELSENYGIKIHDWDDSDPLEDLDYFAGQISALDLVISIDNSTVHMAGALGIPVWTLLPYSSDWRWMFNYEDTPWYPTMRLLRQRSQGEWGEVFERAAGYLSEYTKKGIQDSESRKASRFGMTKTIFAETSDNKNPTAYLPSDNTVYENKCRILRCAVVTPVGPGHEALYNECLESVDKAAALNMGRFAEIIPIRIDDTEGRLGRSRARNLGIKKAADSGADWIFFLDADDIMTPVAFEYAAPYFDDCDCIWGSIQSFDSNNTEPKERPGQLPFIYDLEELIHSDPFVTLQMGHFVKTSAALETLFNEELDAGEDFDYYLRLWKKYSCIKTPLPLFSNRRGRHSQGARSASGKDWRQAVEDILSTYRREKS